MSPYSVTGDGPDAVIIRDHMNHYAVRLTGHPAAHAAEWLDQGWTPDLSPAGVAAEGSDDAEVVPF